MMIHRRLHAPRKRIGNGNGNGNGNGKNIGLRRTLRSSEFQVSRHPKSSRQPIHRIAMSATTWLAYPGQIDRYRR